MALNFGPTLNADLVRLAGLNPDTVDASTFEIVAIDPSSPDTVVRCTTTATIPTADLIGALITYFSPPGSTAATAAAIIHGDGTVPAAQYAAANTWAGLTNGGTELTGGTYARQPVTWTVTGTTCTASAAFNIPAGSTIDGIGFYTAQTGGTATITPVTSQPFTTAGIYAAALTYQET